MKIRVGRGREHPRCGVELTELWGDSVRDFDLSQLHAWGREALNAKGGGGWD
jgi:hypothetical protein